jgi:hypothetical protein
VAACLASYLAATVACIVLVPLLASAPAYQLLLPLQVGVQHKLAPFDVVAPTTMDRISHEANLLAWSLQQLSLCVNMSLGQRTLGRQHLPELNHTTGRMATAWITS